MYRIFPTQQHIPKDSQTGRYCHAPPMSRPISQENLRKWERSTRESTVICNQAAGFNRCLLKIQQNMATQLKAIRVESKGKGPTRVSSAVDELQFLLDFNSGVCQAMAKSMEHLTEFVFVNMANATLLRPTPSTLSELLPFTRTLCSRTALLRGQKRI